MFKSFKITCDEATTICDKAQYGEASFVEKLKLNWHILVCKICRMYSHQNGILTKVYKNQAVECRSKKFSLSEDDKLALKQKIKEIS
ncbi:conserved hypothetical protein [Tenacibaculum litopenaei]|jgi:hypothetical protein|uniref:hypothetical protein n=1 Tax=Tenacibaculum litopenaei TaxID=396016 RepID=UPI003892EBD1